jgi:putative component of toxin-antitoxin plasmid stabilization module
VADEFEIEFYADANGRVHFRKWLDELNEPKRLAMIAAIERILAKLGPGVCGSEWGKKLGASIFEFRVRHGVEEIRAMFPDQPELGAKVASAVVNRPAEKTKKSSSKIVLRAFCHLRPGGKIVLILGGYDKGEHPSPRRQQKEIENARKRLKELQIREAREKKQAERLGEATPKQPSRKRRLRR